MEGKDLDYGAMQMLFANIKDEAEVYLEETDENKPEVSIFVYYIGHGIQDNETYALLNEP